MKLRTFSLLATTMSTALLLGACQTTGSTPNAEQTRAEKIDAAMERAHAKVDAKTGKAGSPERDYKNNAEDAESAIRYARSLRDDQSLTKAALVIKPFADDSSSPAAAKTEYAAIMLAQGDYQTAERYAQKAVLQDPEDHEAYHYLGVALDAQGKHPEAERAFRKALDHWDGDPTTVMNNLALNLASQEYLDEAVEILYKAKAISPNRVEVERNLRIVLALQQSSGHRSAPKPKKRPEGSPAAAMPVIKPVEKTVEAAPHNASGEDVKVMPKVEAGAVESEPVSDTGMTAEKPAKAARAPGSGNE